MWLRTGPDCYYSNSSDETIAAISEIMTTIKEVETNANESAVVGHPLPLLFVPCNKPGECAFKGGVLFFVFNFYRDIYQYPSLI